MSQAAVPARLPAPLGRLIDRNHPVSFSFEGTTYQGFQGDSIASALLANGRWLMSRSFKYHRPRGPLTLAGQDVNTMVQLPSEANVLADIHPITPGLAVMGQNYNGTLDGDRDAILGKFSRFMPVGFYYRAFFKPKGVWKYWEPVIRAKAGLGRIDLEFKPEYYDKVYLFTDVAVIGSGPAGLAAALAAAEAGADVLLIEQESILGGALNWARFDIEGTKADAVAQELVGAVERHPRIRVLTSAVCNAWFADNYLPIIRGQRLYKARAKQCVVASGALEQPVIFRNNDLPGILLTSAAQRLLKLYAVAPGKRAVTLTGNDDGYLAALDLADAGVEVAAVLDLRKEGGTQELVRAVKGRGIPVRAGHTVFEALPGPDGARVAAVDARPITGKGKVGAEGEIIACDTLLMSAGDMPVYQLLCQADGKLHYDDRTARFSITSLPKILDIAGSVNGFVHLDDVRADGRRAGEQAATALGLAPLRGGDQPRPSSAQKENRRPQDRSQDSWPIFPHPKGKEFVDFDADLQIADIVNATRFGYRDIQLIKRFSTVGMGPLQGRHSALPTARLVAEATGRTVSETGVSTARPPFLPEKLAHIAGRAFSPYRQSAMHRRHLEAGAKMMPAGSWLRPAFYGKPEAREQWIQEEARQVRTGVGIIDVSTLGGLDIRGPDAVELLERLYTFNFAKQPVGRSRYALMTAEDGVIIDDGVCCRLDEQHFYVTATTSGVDRVYRSMLKWNAQWRLDVDVANLSAAMAAVNLAGPLARRVLEKVVSGIDLGREDFPYLAVRTGKVAGVPARLIRVGFVGELGYEIHVPARYGEHLWDTLMEAGRAEGIRPFGVESQRLLRLEKGHIIIGQDTDGMTHPAEVGMEWAIGRKKAFFVGKRSIEILEAQPAKRKLAGFVLPKDAPRPLEGQLVLEGDEITGSVTSCEYSGTLEKIIGLAYCAPQQSAIGSPLPIRVADGQVVHAEVVALPFYDPQTQRQEL